jgi:nucleotide-binding universal stress UspA family protein
MTTNTKLFPVIIAGVDDSAASGYAVTYAARLARDHGSRLLLCHWLPLVTPGELIDTDGIIADLRVTGSALLARAAATCSRFGVSAERFMPEGRPADALIALAGEQGATLFVLGTHGRTGLERMFLGSTTETVLRAGTIPVITLRADASAGHEAGRCFARILLGLDDSDQSGAALDVVLDMSPEDRGEVLACAVVDGPTETDSSAALTKVIERAIAAGSARDVTVRGRVLAGRPEDVLVRTAEEEHADLIVVGSHGRRGVRRLVLGSVAEHVVRTAPVPVLVIVDPQR